MSANRAKDHGPRLQEVAQSRGIPGLLEEITSETNPDERRALYSAACRHLPRNQWEGKNLDQVILLYRAAITEFHGQSSSCPDPDTASRLLDGANVLSYNLSADLAPCWPGDEEIREKRHFEEGKRAAGDCLRWREELGKGPGPFGMAWWARGIHCLALGEFESALDAFENSLVAAVELAEEKGEATTLSLEAPFVVLLSHGYLGLARSIVNDAEGEIIFQRVIDAFSSQVEASGDLSKDAAFGRDQLQVAQQRFARNG
ncbi:MAG TPA: hypothetical protein EYN79_00580 [Planctomycetes bacterium]|nr:hypothetical protein [Planctomycetota bacterium]HIN80583.1 hypothetical protein [Planctomycetota bacterium]